MVKVSPATSLPGRATPLTDTVAGVAAFSIVIVTEFSNQPDVGGIGAVTSSSAGGGGGGGGGGGAPTWPKFRALLVA